MISSYITGDKVGRGMVTVVDNDSLVEELPRRVDGYRSDKSKGENQSYIMQPSYGVCTANTLRWRTGMHTIPSTSSIKNIYTSRYPGGVILAPDYSSNEVRAIAAISGCQKLVQAFIDGIDIHKFNASSIWRVPLDQVTSVQRRYAKMGTFSILYGDTPEGFAHKFLAGDESLGRQIFHDFYSAYPEILTWVEARHQEWRRTGKVSLGLTGMFLVISADEFWGDEMKADRASQNYPIQSQSSNIAGYTLNSVDRYFKTNHMLSKTILFIHDSLEFDVHPNEMLVASDKVIHLMNEVPKEEFNFFAKVDLEMGVSLGQGMEAQISEKSEDGRSGIVELEGRRENFDLLISNWSKVYREVDYEVENESQVYVPKSDLFVPKLTLNKNFGTHEIVGKYKVRITY